MHPCILEEVEVPKMMFSKVGNVVKKLAKHQLKLPKLVPCVSTTFLSLLCALRSRMLNSV